MSSIWTPEGEHPVDREPSPRPAAAPSEQPTPEQIEALRTELARTPAATVVANHCIGLFELAALHLSLQPPQLDQAAVAIDALGAVVDRLQGRLGPDEPTVREGLASLRLAFVQVKAASEGAADSAADDVAHGASDGGGAPTA